MIHLPATPISPEVATDPRFITAAVYVGVAVIVAAAFPRVLGPLWHGWQAWVLGARRTQDEQHKADIAALTGRVDLLSRMVADYRHEVDEMRREQNAHNDVLSDHATYDQAMIALVIQLGGQPPPYRPLWPTRPDGHPTATPGDGGYPADLTHP